VGRLIGKFTAYLLVVNAAPRFSGPRAQLPSSSL
jgi:hypothetical protein